MSENVINIPGRIHSGATGNVVTGADEIMDDTRGKKQVVVNNEVEAAILNLAQNKQNVLTFDQTPTEDSTNPVTSGGVYAADKLLSDAIEAILLLIPSAASSLNKLVDLATMNSSIATATASFKGTYNLVSDLHLGVDATHEQIGAALDALSLGADNNDYAFVQVPNSATAPTWISKTERYKFNGANWAFEYDLNNSGFTQGQWNAINSGVTSLLVGKLSDLPTNAELTTLLAGKQDNLTFDNVPTAGSPNPVKSGGVYARNNEIVALINALDAAKQDVLTFDNAPVEGSPNPVKSGGVYTAISAVQAAIVALDAAKQNVLTFDSTPTLGSPNPVTSSGIKTEANRLEGLINANAAAIVTLDNLYRALTQSSLVVVAPTDTWPVASPDAYTIYRVVDRMNTPPQYYSDYMWNGTAMVLMATYDNAIDDEPTAGSNNLVKSGGVYKEYNRKQNIPFDYLYTLIDKDRKILATLDKSLNVESVFEDITTKHHFHIHHPFLSYILTDKNKHILFGLKKDGSIYYPDSNRDVVNKFIPLVVDSDWGGDPDDAMAIRVLCYMNRIGKSKPILFNHIGGTYNGTVPGLNASFLFDGIGNVPIITRYAATGDTPTGNYDSVVADYPHLKTIADGVGTSGYRRYLAQQYRKVTFLTLGTLGSVSDLINSQPDEYSDLNGIELIKEKVDKFVIMGGNLASDTQYLNEYNFTHDPSPAINVVEKLLSNKIKTIYVDFSLVQDIWLGKHIDEHVPTYDIIRNEMEYCRDTIWPNIMNEGRIGADPIAAIVASVDNPEDVGFRMVEGDIYLDGNANTRFVETPNKYVAKLERLYSVDYYVDMMNKILWKKEWF